MRFIAGGRLGPYELLAPLGAGGMGEIYKALDTRLERIVAIKVLPEEFAADPDRRERFEREARAVAALSHPHICNLHDIGEVSASEESSSVDTVRFLVMEHLEGCTLQERLLRGALPIEEALRTAIEIADALDHAHRKGLIHRDLKPSNVMMTSGGAKLLDFGLSKLQSQPSVVGLSTMASGEPLTETGEVLGTFPYMSPEQLQGREADPRSDIFAFGAMLYEMVSGQRAFEGVTPAALIGAILHAVPPSLLSVQPVTPPALARVVDRCLAKSPDDRWQTARDLLLELKWIAEPSAPAVRRVGRGRLSLRAAVTVALAIAAVAVAYIAMGLRPPPAVDSRVTLAFTVPDGLTLVDAAIGGPVTISPNGQRFAFVAKGTDGKQRLWVRTLDSLAAQPLEGTDGAVFPFWSPDSRAIGFFAERRLKVVQVAGGRTQTLCEAIQPRGGTMNASGEIVFSADAGRQLFRVGARGGEPQPIAGDGFNDERYWPIFLPDGRRFVYFGRPQRRGVYVAEVGSSDARLLLGDHVLIAYSHSGHLLTLAGFGPGELTGKLIASRFDAARLAVDGEWFSMSDNVPYHSDIARGEASVSDNGVLVYGNIRHQTTALVWFDRSGKEIGPRSGTVRFMRRTLQSDGATRLWLGMSEEPQQSDVLLRDMVPNSQAFISFGPRRQNKSPRVFEGASGGPAQDDALRDAAVDYRPTDWSSDGRLLVYARQHPRRQWDLFVIPVTGDRANLKPRPFLQTEFNEHLGRVSPDGRWLAYVSDASGGDEVYLKPFPDTGMTLRISTAGGSDPMWRGDGRELFYLAPDGTLMAVTVEAEANFEVRGAVPLFKMRNSQHGLYESHYTLTADGQRFLVNTVSAESTVAPAVVVLNWTATLSSR